MKMNNSKTKWMLSLKPGDIVCTWDFKHLPIYLIKDIRNVRYPQWLKSFIWFSWWPTFLCMLADDFYHWISNKIGNTIIIDRELELDNGSLFDKPKYLALAGCNKENHKWRHPSPYTEVTAREIKYGQRRSEYGARETVFNCSVAHCGRSIDEEWLHAIRTDGRNMKCRLCVLCGFQ